MRKLTARQFPAATTVTVLSALAFAPSGYFAAEPAPTEGAGIPTANAATSIRSHDSAKADKPNLVLIFIDDMGYADIAPFGNKKVRTPNLDRMVEILRNKRPAGTSAAKEPAA